MEFTYENQGVNTFLVWKLEQEDVIDNLIKGMTENNEINGILPLTFSQNNLDRFIKYNISSKVTLKQYLSGMVSKKNFIRAMRGLMSALLELDDYMIERDKVLLDIEHIYVNVSTAQIGLVVLPIENISETCEIGEFLRNIMFHIQFNPNENGNYIAAILNFLNQGIQFSIAEFSKLLDEQLGESVSEKKVVEKKTQPVKESVQSPALNGGQWGSTSSQSTAPSSMSQTVSTSQSFSAPKTGSVTPSVSTPQASPLPQTMPPQVSSMNPTVEKKKEKRGLFGKKKESEPAKASTMSKIEKKTKKSAGTQPSFQGGFAIPGQQSMQNTYQQVPQSSYEAPHTAVQQSDMAKPMESKPAMTMNTMQQSRQPVMQEIKMDFGETTVLSQGSVSSETTVLTANVAGAELKPYILRKKNNQKVFIDKPEFKIGKESSYVDYCITDNSAVSRSHADIVTRNGAYFIRDNNSLNHTFLDGMQLQSGSEVQLVNGVKFKLADEEFEFWLY